MPGNCENGLATLGWLLDRRRIRDRFITLDPVGVTVTIVRQARPIGTRFYRHERLDRLARLVAHSPRHVPAAGDHSPREALLRLAGRALDEQRCHAAFIVVYDDLLLIDDDRLAPDSYGPTSRPATVIPVGA